MKYGKLSGASFDAIRLMFVKVLTMVLGFAITRLLSEFLPVHDYGTYSQIMLVVTTVSSLTILGMMDGVNYYHCSETDPEKREQYVSTLFAMQCIVSVFAGMIVFLLGGALCRSFDNADIKKYLLFAAVLPLLQNVVAMLQLLLVSVGKSGVLALRNLLVSALRLVVVVLVVTTVQSIQIVFLFALVLDSVQVWLLILFLRNYKCKISIKSVNVCLIEEILQYCIPLAIFISLKSLNRDLDKYLIGFWTDTGTLAVYANASKALPFDVIMHAFFTVLIPEITRQIATKNFNEAAYTYRIFLEIGYMATIVPCFAALAASPQLMQLLYSEKYLSGLPVFCIYILVDMLQSTNITLILSAAGRTKLLVLLGGGMLAVNALLNAVLYQAFGVCGPALATLIVTLTMGILLLSFGARELHVRLRDLFNIPFLGTFMMENVLILWALVQFRRYLASSNVPYYFTLIIICAIYVAVFAALHGKRLLINFGKLNQATRHH